jgi:hypothetical protein
MYDTEMYDLQGGGSGAPGFHPNFFSSSRSRSYKMYINEKLPFKTHFFDATATSDAHGKEARSFIKMHATLECYFTTTVFFATPCGVS